jgi:hypothetical protein
MVYAVKLLCCLGLSSGVWLRGNETLSTRPELTASFSTMPRVADCDLDTDLGGSQDVKEYPWTLLGRFPLPFLSFLRVKAFGRAASAPSETYAGFFLFTYGTVSVNPSYISPFFANSVNCEIVLTPSFHTGFLCNQCAVAC